MRNLWQYFLLIDLVTSILLSAIFVGTAFSTLFSMLIVRIIIIGLLAPSMFGAIEVLSTGFAHLRIGVLYTLVLSVGYFIIPAGIILVQFGSLSSAWLYRRLITDVEAHILTYLPYYLASGVCFILFRKQALCQRQNSRKTMK